VRRHGRHRPSEVVLLCQVPDAAEHVGAHVDACDLQRLGEAGQVRAGAAGDVEQAADGRAPSPQLADDEVRLGVGSASS